MFKINRNLIKFIKCLNELKKTYNFNSFLLFVNQSNVSKYIKIELHSKLFLIIKYLRAIGNDSTIKFNVLQFTQNEYLWLVPFAGSILSPSVVVSYGALGM